jgi:hypothetical protein
MRLKTTGRGFVLGLTALGALSLGHEAALAQIATPTPAWLTVPPPSPLSVQAVIGETGSYSSNPLLTIDSSKPLIGSTTTPELILRNRTDASKLDIDATIDENVFNQSLYNSTDVHANTLLATRNQPWNAQVQLGTHYDTTRTSELSNFNFTPTVSRHLGISVAPQVSFAPTAVDTLALGGSFASSQYQDNIFTNYQTFAATPTYTHQFDPLNAGFVTLLAQRYQTTRGPQAHIDTIGPSVGGQTTFSPRLSAHAAIGAQTTRQYQSDVALSPWTWQFVFSGGLVYQGEQDTLDLSATRAQDPYGNGTEALQTTLSASESHALNSLVSLNAGASYLTSTYPVTTPGSVSSLAQASAGATLHLTQDLDLSATYQYRYETLIGNSATPDDHSGMINLTFHPQIWSL